MEMKEKIKKWLDPCADAVGFAPVDRLAQAPEQHHPSRVCRSAATVIVVGKAVPRGILRSPDYGLYGLHRAYHTVYKKLDELTLDLCNMIERETQSTAIQVPAFAPMVYHGREPWGVMSLKHAAAAAGLGTIGKNGLLISPDFGSMLRLAAVVTSEVIEPDPLADFEPCEQDCDLCKDACPNNAFDHDCNFNKMACMAATIKHGIYPLALKSEDGRKNIELIINTAGHNYWIGCLECLKVCPNNARVKTENK